MVGSRTKGKFTVKRYQIPTLFNTVIFKRHVKAIRQVQDEGIGLLLSEIHVIVNSEEDSNLLNEDVMFPNRRVWRQHQI